MALTLEEVRDWINLHFPTETGRRLFLQALGVAGAARATTKRRVRRAVRAARATVAGGVARAPRPGTLPAKLLAFSKTKPRFTNSDALMALGWSKKRASQVGNALHNLAKQGHLRNLSRGVWKLK